MCQDMRASATPRADCMCSRMCLLRCQSHSAICMKGCFSRIKCRRVQGSQAPCMTHLGVGMHPDTFCQSDPSAAVHVAQGNVLTGLSHFSKSALSPHVHDTIWVTDVALQWQGIQLAVGDDSALHHRADPDHRSTASWTAQAPSEAPATPHMHMNPHWTNGHLAHGKQEVRTSAADSSRCPSRR